MKTLQIKTEIQILSYDELTPEQLRVVTAAREATALSYSPYSHFQVGAAVLLDNGEIVSGANQENVAYPSGLCAERTTLFYAGAHYPKAKIQKMAIAAYSAGAYTEEVISPCGACRQVICENEDRAGAPIEIMLCSATEVWVFQGIESLMPLPVRAGTLER